MLINEACKACSLTKKAIAYYEAQQLVQPLLSENGYRHFADSEVEKLKKIAVLRKLGLSVPEIRLVLEQKSSAPLHNALAKKALEMEVMKAKQALAEKLAQDVYRLQALFAAFNRESGYNDIFIPAMKRLSPSYREYHAALQKADQVFVAKYPEAAPQS